MPRLLDLWSRAWKPQPLKPEHPRAHATVRETTSMRSASTQPENSPYSAPREIPHSNKDAAQPKINTEDKNIIYLLSCSSRNQKCKIGLMGLKSASHGYSPLGDARRESICLSSFQRLTAFLGLRLYLQSQQRHCSDLISVIISPLTLPPPSSTSKDPGSCTGPTCIIQHNFSSSRSLI